MRTSAALTPGTQTLATLGGMLAMVGLLFKVGAVPFHAWAPDAYEGAPSFVTGWMSVGVKVAAFGGVVRLLTALGDCGAFGSQQLGMATTDALTCSSNDGDFSG